MAYGNGLVVINVIFDERKQKVVFFKLLKKDIKRKKTMNIISKGPLILFGITALISLLLTIKVERTYSYYSYFYDSLFVITRNFLSAQRVELSLCKKNASFCCS